MRSLIAAAVVIGGTLAGFAAVNADDKAEKKKNAGPMIGHMVYFKLKDGSAENRAKLVAACDKYLTDHEGTTFYAAGVISDDFKREVNDRDWDVALHLVFADKAAHDKYQDHERHKAFIDENKAGWEKVRVFDAACETHGKKKKKEKKDND
jgi:quinol monooxygenase YgiN